MLPWKKKKTRVAIIGDLILDEYLEGTVTRISPEAPVPVHVVTSTSHSAGGAANAARNVSTAGGQAVLFGVCGKDEAADVLLTLLNKENVDTSSVITTDRPTIRKTRITSNHHQMLRVDWEKVQALEDSYQETLLASLKKQKMDAILVSDYGKGLLPRSLLANIFKFARENHIPTLVDPKGTDFDRYQGCDLITPNLQESKRALGWEDNGTVSGEDLGKALQKKFGLADVLVTMGPQGMVYVPAHSEEAPVYRKAEAKEVFDVSGAGDTVVAIFALCLGAGASRERSLTLSNLAAAIVVGKWGTQPIYEHELLEPESKSKPKKKTVVFTNGCFDILHAGHVEYLQKARSLGDYLIVGLNSDRSVRTIKGPSRPINPLIHRQKVLSALSCVDEVVPFDEDTPLRLIQEISPDILVKGADYSVDEIVGASFVKSKGGEVKTIELVPNVSTSAMLENIRNKLS
ncbi:MAG: D-glycero-beta-D-manno-heptose 1-phosphate adenylyltransferase [Deltaproteobacteria bacterium]|nr:D-glycero-beta-D-manno-heptose 1-phosphate adenylyltransferase [Deltaproteobacteria bacterium]